ncbi:MAG: hypothetical protein H0U95_05165 [Bacteroidetes bacterium]|nr:hypothetical protein [Bacteroidota bacterium]
MKSIKTRTGEFFVDKDNILHVVMFANVVVDYEDAVDNFLVMKNLTNNQPCIKLVNLVNNTTFESKAKTYIKNKEVQSLTIARAVLTTNNVKKISLNFFLKFSSGKVRAKFFTDYNEAIDWLKLFMK